MNRTPTPNIASRPPTPRKPTVIRTIPLTSSPFTDNSTPPTLSSTPALSPLSLFETSSPPTLEEQTARVQAARDKLADHKARLTERTRILDGFIKAVDDRKAWGTDWCDPEELEKWKGYTASIAEDVATLDEEVKELEERLKREEWLADLIADRMVEAETERDEGRRSRRSIGWFRFY